MATLSKNILPIPESVVVGSGSYTVPANKYGFFQAFTNTLYSESTVSDGNSSTANQWLCSGSSISVSSSGIFSDQTFSGTRNASIQYWEASASVLINGSTILNSRSLKYWREPGGTTNVTYLVRAVSYLGWSVALFPIPVDNLPASLTT